MRRKYQRCKSISRRALLGMGLALCLLLPACGASNAAGADTAAASSTEAGSSRAENAGAQPTWEPIPESERKGGSSTTDHDSLAEGNGASDAGAGLSAATESAESDPARYADKSTADASEAGTGNEEDEAGDTADDPASEAAEGADADAIEADTSAGGAANRGTASSTADSAGRSAASSAGAIAGRSATSSTAEPGTSMTAEAGTSSDAALVSLMQTFMQNYGLNSSNFACAYRNLSTGVTYYFNELRQWDACSTYKLPLNLLYYDMQAAGQISGDTIIPGTSTPLAECHHQSLEFSNNPLSEAMMNNLGSYDKAKQSMRRYFTLTDAETADSYYHHNYFCARQMMDCAQYVYNHQNDYSEALGYLEAAQPGQYFRRYLPNVTIAQKYGLRDGYNHNAGIIFADTPFVLSVYSYQAGGDEMIARCAQTLYDYTEQ